MRPIKLLLPLALLFCVASGSQAQTLSVVLPQDSVMPWMIRTPDGGYLGRRRNGPSVVKFDANMQELWGVDFGNSEVSPYTLASFKPLPDGGVIAIGGLGPVPFGQDSLQDRSFVLRLNATGDQVFAKYIHYVPNSIGFSDIMPYSYFGEPISVNQQAESFISLGSVLGSYGPMILKLDSAGLPQWMVELPENQTLLDELTPDNAGGCYFVSQDYTYELIVGHILQNGILDWCNSFSRNNAYFAAPMRSRIANNGNIVVGGPEGSNLLWMEMTSSGTLIQYRLLACVPPAGYGLSGFGQLTNGDWVALHGGNDGSRISFFGSDGTWSGSYDSPEVLHGNWFDRLFLEGLSVRGNEFSVNGYFRRRESVFNFQLQHPSVSTFNAGTFSHCLFYPGNAAQTSIPVASINVESMPAFITQLPVPTVADTSMQITVAGNWPASGLCELATSVENLDIASGGIRILGNPVALGSPIVLEINVPGTITIMDITGRSVTGKVPAERGRVEVSTSGLATGIYLVSILDRSGKQVFSQPVVLQ